MVVLYEKTNVDTSTSTILKRLTRITLTFVFVVAVVRTESYMFSVLLFQSNL